MYVHGVFFFYQTCIIRLKQINHAHSFFYVDIGLPTAYPSLGILIKALSDPVNKVRESAVSTLGKFGPDVALDCTQHVASLIQVCICVIL